MKIIDVRVIPVNSFLYVKVYTDEGIEGLGESGAWGFLPASAEAVESFKTYLIGQDPLQIEHHWQYMYHRGRHPGFRKEIYSGIGGILHSKSQWRLVGT